jgi:L-threonylcarbamoyladenylate synthase
MPTELVAVDPQRPDVAALARAAEVIRRGGLVAFPTETVYGLGADATTPAAVGRIFQAKGRPPSNPTIVHVADVAAAIQCASAWSKEADDLANAFWPGPLTIIVPVALKRIAPQALAGGSTVGLRIPAHPVALALLGAAETPIAAPSANRSESLSPTTAEHVLRTLDGRIDMILDAGPTSGGVESTVVDLSVSPPRLLRPGLIAAERLRRFLPDIEVGAKTDAIGVMKSPGRAPRHYAPTTPLELVADLASKPVAAGARRVGVVAFDESPIPTPEGAVLRRLPGDPAAAAQSLYAILHELDSMNLEIIIVQRPPSGDDWSAIRDRLQRASTLKE